MKNLFAKSCLLSAALLMASAVHAESNKPTDPKSPLCYYLNLNIDSDKFDFVTTPLPVPRTGFIINWTKKSGTLKQDVYGPNTELTIIHKESGKKAVFDVEQKVCVLEAGAITVLPKEGLLPIKWEIQHGSFGQNKPGIVTFK